MSRAINQRFLAVSTIWPISASSAHAGEIQDVVAVKKIWPGPITDVPVQTDN